MKIYTGYFARQKQYKEAGLTLISIARSARYFSGLSYKDLAPTWEMINDPEEIYIPKYRAILSKLDPYNVISNLKGISGNNDVILLCHEKIGSFCHRNLVAQWLNEKLNIEVKEFDISGKQIPVTQKSLY